MPIEYYAQLFELLISGLLAGLSYANLAELLTSKGVKTPTGRDWKDSSIKNCLKCLRNPSRYPSRLYDALVGLIANKQLTLERAKPLFQIRIINQGEIN